jgi:hypothetical protein
MGNMILDRQERFVVSSVGWVERGGFVRRDLHTGELINFPSGDSDYLRLFSVDGDRFMAVGHAPERDIIMLSVRRFDAPDLVLWSLSITPTRQTISGDPAAVAGIRRHHLATFKNGGKWDFHLITIDPDGANATLGALPWYNGNTYDLGYQGPIDVVSIPDSELVLVSVQRSSTIVVHDPAMGRDVDRFDLAGSHGNPILTIVGKELWTIDYDTFVRVDLESRKVIKSLKVQPSTPYTSPSFKGMMNQFAGELFIWTARKKAVIPRPFSGDVVIVDPETCSIELAMKLKGQPLSCVVTTTGALIARDWKSGDWLAGNIQSSTAT